MTLAGEHFSANPWQEVSNQPGEVRAHNCSIDAKHVLSCVYSCDPSLTDDEHLTTPYSDLSEVLSWHWLQESQKQEYRLVNHKTSFRFPHWCDDSVLLTFHWLNWLMATSEKKPMEQCDPLPGLECVLNICHKLHWWLQAYLKTTGSLLL